MILRVSQTGTLYLYCTAETQTRRPAPFRRRPTLFLSPVSYCDALLRPGRLCGIELPIALFDTAGALDFREVTVWGPLVGPQSLDSAHPRRCRTLRRRSSDHPICRPSSSCLAKSVFPEVRRSRHASRLRSSWMAARVSTVEDFSASDRHLRFLRATDLSRFPELLVCRHPIC